MRFYEEQQLEMLNRVAGFLKEKKDTFIAKVPALDELINGFIEKHHALYMLTYTGKDIVTITTLQKKTIKEGLLDKVKLLSEMLYAHLYAEGNHEMNLDGEDSGEKTTFDYSASQLKRMSANELCRVTRVVVNAAKKVRHVQRYGITHDDIKDTEAYYAEFSASKDKPLHSKKEVATRNVKISREIKECISILDNRIDRLMSIATRDDSNLGHEYNSRRIVLGNKFGRPTDKEVRYRKSRKKKITGEAVKKALFVD